VGGSMALMNEARSMSATIVAWLAHPLIDRWLPDDAAATLTPIVQLRMRILSAMLQGLAVLALLFGIVDASSGLLALSSTSFGGVLLATLTLARMRSGATLQEIAVLASGTTYAVIVLNASLNGGLQAPALYFLPLVPLVPLLVDAPRLAMGWVAVSCVTVAAAFVIEGPMGRPLPQAMTADMLPLNQLLVIGAASCFVNGAFLLHTVFGTWVQERLVLAESHRSLRVLDASTDAIVRIDPFRTVTSANAAARALFQAGQLAGRPIEDLLPDVQALERASGASIVHAVSAGDGSVPVEASCTALSDGWVLVIRDIRERMAARERLEQALGEAKAASEAKSRFLAAMSHELRTPLNAVIGYAEMIGEDVQAGCPPTDTTDLDHIVGSARHLLALIDQVLDLAKVEAGRMEVERRHVTLDAFARDLDTVGRALARSRGNQWQARLPEAPIVVSLDEVRTRQIVLNLLSNAAKFCGDGVITLDISWHGDLLTIAVSDTGIGMTDEQLQAVWEEFSQAEVSTQRVFGGTGLGLPLVKRLTALLGGTVQAESTPGQGTSFRVELPTVAA